MVLRIMLSFFDILNTQQIVKFYKEKFSKLKIRKILSTEKKTLK